ncbi:MAG TPA: hypothetical protein VG408_00130, partial [Actinomycetota bacterium]|nr:hypothetical protein [Actinomycetota bacterium]
MPLRAPDLPPTRAPGTFRAVVAIAVGVVFTSTVVPSLGAAAPESCGDGKPTKSVTGSFTKELEGSYVFVPFRVPAGTTRVNVRLCYDQPESPTSSQVRHTLDL